MRKGDNLHLVPLSERLFYLESDPICTRELAISIVRTNQEFLPAGVLDPRCTKTGFR